MWITSGIKKSSNKKNKLFNKWLCSRNLDDEKKYTNNLEVFKKVTAAAQITFNKEKFDTRINTTK